MGSASDLPVMEGAQKVLEELGVSCEMTVVSAHRTPERMVEYAKSAAARGVGVIIAGAGGAAHLPGMTASLTALPVIGVPIKSRNSIDGWDSVLSILQMPSGVPVATVALDGGTNAGILAAQILGATDDALRERLAAFKEALKARDIDLAMEPALTVLLPVGIGVIAGVVIVGNLLSWLLKRFEKQTLGLLVGLLVGSVIGLFPFQQGVPPQIGDIAKSGEVITEVNVELIDKKDWPIEVFQPALWQVISAAGLAVLGFAITLGVAFVGRDKPEKSVRET